MKKMIENKHSAVVLGTYDAETDEDALEMGISDDLVITDLDSSIITDYVMKEIETDDPGTALLINIYAGPNGLLHTTGSMEYRDTEHVHVVSIKLKNEYAPYDYEGVYSIINHALKEKQTQSTDKTEKR